MAASATTRRFVNVCVAVIGILSQVRCRRRADGGPGCAHGAAVEARAREGARVIGINVSNFNDIATGGILADLSGTEAATAVDNEAARASADALDSGGDGNVAIPWPVNAQVVLYNIDQFEEMGLETPTDWDEFLQLVEDIRSVGEKPFYFPNTCWSEGTGASVAWAATSIPNSSPHRGCGGICAPCGRYGWSR